MAGDTTGTSIEWLVLADAAQIVSNKLFLLGGGWDRYTVSQFPAQMPFAVAVSLRVPWNETNQQHSFELEVATQDGQSLVKMGGAFEVGRPPGIPLGSDQRLQLAMNGSLKLEKAGLYVIIGRVEGQEAARTAFTVVSHSQPVQR
ncbi:MAG: hypothetical protein Q7T26_05375 [Dehalococcoidia bacterium]|nr:hypothetical protein [Dehalococcoidia bacterium]